MSIDAIDTSISTDDSYSSWFSKDQLNETFCTEAFRAASYLTDPISKTHEYYRSLLVVDALNPTAYKVTNLMRKFFLAMGLFGFAALAAFTTVPGIALRSLAAHMQKAPYIHSQGSAPLKALPNDRSFSLLSWNICCIGGGYSITDGGVVPWHSRIDAILNRIIEKNADVNCLYETFDTKAAFYICEKLKQKGYADFYFDIGAQAIGTSSGILVASKYKIKNPEFTLFPQDTLVGGTKYAAKGVFAFDLESQGNSFARIFSTHLQHSREPAIPTPEEIDARKRQMQIMLDKIDGIRNRCLVVTGDLNLEDDEYRASSWHTRFQKGDQWGDESRTWGGDAFCARLMGIRGTQPMNLDHTMVVNATARAISTSLVETGFDGTVFRREALSDHAGLLSRITI